MAKYAHLKPYIINHVIDLIQSFLIIFDKFGNIIEYYPVRGNSCPEINLQLFNDITQNNIEERPNLFMCFYPVCFMSIKHEDSFVVIGPVNTNRAIQSIDGVDISDYFHERYKLNTKFASIPLCDLNLLSASSILIYNELKGTNLSLRDIFKSNFQSNLGENVEKELSEIKFYYQENNKLHNSYDNELRIKEAVKKGDINATIKAMGENILGEKGTLSRDPLRATKNLSISIITILTRSGIEGGILPEEAYSLSDAFILSIDEAESIHEVNSLVDAATVKFAMLVNEIRNTDKTNRIIQDAKNVIHSNLHEKIVINDIAKKLYITPQYLSTLFKKLEGISISEYICEKKISMAEDLLKYSDYSIEEIAYYLGFCSQSYFGKCFKNKTQLSPLKYRDKFEAKELKSKCLKANPCKSCE